jgi:pyruvate formate-lyase activating enzyme-like uncharacterized protein
MVLLITGRCDESCYYCPLSREKKGRDVVYANELLVSSEDDVLHEAEMIRATGTGITGGDPLCVPDRTMGYIRLLKSRFGGTHHVHLYTSTVDKVLFEEIEGAGLDELRLHPMVSDWAHPEGLGLEEAVEGLDIHVGLEVPAIPGEEEGLYNLIKHAERLKLDFVNLNELEFSETNADRLRSKGFEVKDDVSSAVLGSEELALALIRYGGFHLPVHYCSSSFKDKVQLRNRILRRARNVAEDLDVITDEGMLYKGVVETDRYEEVMAFLRERHGVPDHLMRADPARSRVEVAPWVLESLASELPYPCFLVEEYPTADRLEVERAPLNRLRRKGKG